MSSRRKTRTVSSGTNLATPKSSSAVPRKSALSVKSGGTSKKAASSRKSKVTIAPEAMKSVVSSMRSSAASADKAARTGAGRPSMPAVATQGALSGIADPSVAFYGVKPIAIVDDLVNALHDYACDGLDVLEARLAETTQLDESSHAVTAGLDKAQKALQASIDAHGDRLEVFALKVMELPEAMGVAEATEAVLSISGDNKDPTSAAAARRRSSMGTVDGLPASMSTDSDEFAEFTDPARVKMLNEQLAAARSKVIATRFVNDAMKKEIASIKADLKQSQPLRDAMAFIQDAKNSAGIAGPLTDVASETLHSASDAFRSVRDLAKIVGANVSSLETSLGIKAQYQKDAASVAGSGLLDPVMVATLAPPAKIVDHGNGRQSLGNAQLDLTPGRK